MISVHLAKAKMAFTEHLSTNSKKCRAKPSAFRYSFGGNLNVQRMMRVLILDEDSAVRETIANMLSRAGFAADTLENPEDAASFLQDHVPDAILLDVAFRTENAWRIAEEIREMAPDLPIIVMTAWQDWCTPADVMRQGCNGYLGKPFTLHDLVLETLIAISSRGRARRGMPIASAAAGCELVPC